MLGGTYIVSEVPAPHPDVPHAVGPEKAVPRLVQPGALPNTDENPRTTTTNRPTDTNRGTDEWAGALAAEVIRRPPLGYLKALASRCRAGDMSVRYAIESLL